MLTTSNLSALASTALVAALGLAARAAAAQDGALYVGANAVRTLGTYSRSDIDAGLVNGFSAAGAGLAITSSSAHHDAANWSAELGYAADRYLSIEASYLDLGTLKYASQGSSTSLFGSSPTSAAVEVKSRGPALALIGVLPLLDGWQFDARVGAYEGKTSTSLSDAVGANSGSESLSKSTTSMLYGAGGAYSFLGHWSVRLEYLHLNHLEDKVLGKSFNVDLATAGLSYAF